MVQPPHDHKQNMYFLLCILFGVAFIWLAQMSINTSISFPIQIFHHINSLLDFLMPVSVSYFHLAICSIYYIFRHTPRSTNSGISLSRSPCKRPYFATFDAIQQKLAVFFIFPRMLENKLLLLKATIKETRGATDGKYPRYAVW